MHNSPQDSEFYSYPSPDNATSCTACHDSLARNYLNPLHWYRNIHPAMDGSVLYLVRDIDAKEYRLQLSEHQCEKGQVLGIVKYGQHAQIEQCTENFYLAHGGRGPAFFTI
jgi:hypothetical protein